MNYLPSVEMRPTGLAGRHLVTIIIARGGAGIKPNLPGACRGVSMGAHERGKDEWGAGMRGLPTCRVFPHLAAFCGDGLPLENRSR